MRGGLEQFRKNMGLPLSWSPLFHTWGSDDRPCQQGFGSSGVDYTCRKISCCNRFAALLPINVFIALTGSMQTRNRLIAITFPLCNRPSKNYFLSFFIGAVNKKFSVICTCTVPPQFPLTRRLDLKN
jgi:hypothetical protein